MAQRATLLGAAAVLPLPALAAVLDPAGPSAAQIAELSWVLFVGAAAIFLIVMALAWRAVRGGGRPLDARRLIVGGGIVFPAVVLSALLGYGTGLSGMLTAAPTQTLEIVVTGRRWWWEVRYPATPGAVTANEIHVPVGRPVRLRLESGDVIHSFWVPQLAGKVDLIPGRTNTLLLRADREGVFGGQCAEYCGSQHALMGLAVVAQSPGDFADWLARQAAPVLAPADPVLAAGRAAFLGGGCPVCHTIRGEPAAGTLGPDLTHVGGRRTLGAGAVVSNPGTMAGWIADSQGIKPGNLMPPQRHFDGPTLRALAAYLLSLA